MSVYATCGIASVKIGEEADRLQEASESAPRDWQGARRMPYPRPMNGPVATVIIPTFNHGKTLDLSVRSALAQTVPVEVFIVGDGVPEPNRHAIDALVRSDRRVSFFDHPKHANRGESYRHEAVGRANGRIICYLCDRDLWQPDHVSTMDDMLRNADFCHSLPLHVLPDGGVRTHVMDLRIPIHRRNMLVLWNRVPLSCAAHTTAFYHQLETGWEAPPEGQLSDWHFFRKFLKRRDCRCASGVGPSAITFPTGPRPGWTDDQRLAEMALWQAKMETEMDRQAISLKILQQAVKDRDNALGHAFTQLFEQHQQLKDRRASA